jgi:Domain of unknown function (DUF5625)
LKLNRRVIFANLSFGLILSFIYKHIGAMGSSPKRNTVPHFEPFDDSQLGVATIFDVDIKERDGYHLKLLFYRVGNSKSEIERSQILLGSMPSDGIWKGFIGGVPITCNVQIFEKPDQRRILDLAVVNPQTTGGGGEFSGRRASLIELVLMPGTYTISVTPISSDLSIREFRKAIQLTLTYRGK